MLTSLDLANRFGLKILHGNLNCLKRPIIVPELDRPGLELSGLFDYHEKKRIMLIGNKEMALINNSSSQDIYQNCIKICNPECPGVIITHGNTCPEPLLRAATDTDCPLFVSDSDTSQLESDMYVYLTESLAPKTAIHACLMEIYDVGVIIQGESGIGKSEISLDLIKKGHRLIADDRVNIAAVRGHLLGTCPESIYGMMEVRGIGIIDVSRVFGINSLADSSLIRLIIDLVAFDQNAKMERIGMKTERTEILGESVPVIKLPVSAARSMSDIIETAVTNFKLKEVGYDTGYEFQRRLEEMKVKQQLKRREDEMIITERSLEKVERAGETSDPEKNDKR